MPLSALSAGVKYLDASLAGMGKGTGNLKTEFFTAYLLATQQKSYDLTYIVEAANYIRKRFPTDPTGLDYGEFLRGLYDLSTAELKVFSDKRFA